jgi:hypothetical protein
MDNAATAFDRCSLGGITRRGETGDRHTGKYGETVSSDPEVTVSHSQERRRNNALEPFCIGCGLRVTANNAARVRVVSARSQQTSVAGGFQPQ